ncbi:lactate/malate dehydrogenase [Calycina marina]|uniref:malate dehydrogenase n=1 Tax=Calycina marina TaxID=1763456 RepID=A0A9P7Z637_9HELO|nr:lactate/malate dehydrogenase [Calycina marina]
MLDVKDFKRAGKLRQVVASITCRVLALEFLGRWLGLLILSNTINHPYHLISSQPLFPSQSPILHTMFAARRALSGAIQQRAFSASARDLSKVTVLGAAGGIGQPLSLLLKLNPRVTDLALYDIRLAPGVAADISHINTKSLVTGYEAGEKGLDAALQDAEIVLIPAGVPRKPGMTRDDLFNTNASIVRDLAKAAAKSAPNAKILVISNPVNSTVPIVAEIFKKAGVYNPKRLFGVTTLDVVRASRFVSEIKKTDPVDENIVVVGGHSGVTIVPLFSQSAHQDLVGEPALLKRVQFGGDEVVAAKDGAGSATLSMAMAGARFAESLLKAAQGEKGVIEPTFIDSPLYKDQGVDFFASKVELGPDGVAQIYDVGKIDAKEQELLDACLADLKKNIEKGVKFVAENPGK